MRIVPSLAGMAAAVVFASAAQAEVVQYMAMMNGPTEVPAHQVPGTGMAMATLDTDTKTFTWNIQFKDLTGPATMAHVHGPALPGANAPPVIVLGMPIASGASGASVLTDAQIADLNAGKWYVNVHTEANKGGEIRGQLLMVK